MRYPKSILVFLLALLMCAAVPRAEMEEDEYPGELRIRVTNYTYPRVQVDGESWDSTEFEKNGKVVVVLDLDRSKESVEVTLLPGGELAPAVLTVRSKEFKRKRKGRTLFFVANRKVTFKKAKAEPAPKTPGTDTPGTEPDEKPKPAPAPTPGDDDL